ncbi:hypothetical protein CAI21_04040 [Alkalilimnicola ehrlichii]|uniref:Molybdopterin molybdenumtransferase n=2 Tax=Alkalilimnicola ehrlichii TaxID=351052 RepID=A0A3E0X2J8_9GAMM|nr:hypothetical protein CAI21_04040 [Alkalilimnicola ehrlichii]RFA38413.1 hypothetical protein CAL65_05410 [Alkalilimnicola ehrlichii]
MLSIRDAIAALLAASSPAPRRQTLPIGKALGRTLLQSVTAQADVPGHDNSAMDGYAVSLADLAETRRLPVGSTIQAGARPSELLAGNAARIYTGAPIPTGADAVVMQEQCDAADGYVQLPSDIKPGQNIRRAGEDVARGSTVLQPGRRLRAQELGLIASVGVAEVEVAAPLKIALLTTGDELVPAGRPLAPGQIHDSNGPMLAALVESLGFTALTPRHLPDDPALTRQYLAEAAVGADVIITTGGVSVGDADYVKPAVEALGELGLWKVAIKPGKPFAFGRVGDTPFIGLPGNPVSVFVTFLILARPLLMKLQGIESVDAPPEFPLPAGFTVERADRRRETFLRTRLCERNGTLWVEAYPHQGSGVLSSTCWADGLVRLKPGQTVAEGDILPYTPMSSLLCSH